MTAVPELPMNSMRWYPPRRPEAARHTPWQGLLAGWQHLSGQTRHALQREVDAVLLAVSRCRAMDVAELRTALARGRAVWGRQRRRQDPGIRAELMAQICLAAQATLGQMPSRPQITAAIAMVDGHAVQLAPGEGKTLAVAMAAVMLAWSGRPCHVVTANDYLAGRDAALMAPLLNLCSCTVEAITHETPREQLADCYQADVLYATAGQLLADFLRDHLLLGSATSRMHRHLWNLRDTALGPQPVMRGLYAAIIDEADGVLIDEATTPLIISSPQKNPLMVQAILSARDMAEQLEVGRDYLLLGRERQQLHFTPAGQERIEHLASALPSFWQVPERRENLFSMALLARDVYQRDRHYVVQDGRVMIVDESTGRVMPDRSWSHGIHQSIEAREGLELTDPSRTVARMTFQEFFRHYHRLCGASGTLHGIGWELWRTYGLRTLRVAPRVPSQLNIRPRRGFADRASKIAALVDEIIHLQQQGLPVLVGTRQILDSEEIASMLHARGFACAVLNAKQHKLEAQIVADAGRPGCITVATNMAGRGTDILLPPEIARAGGLQVLSFEVHDSARVDWQLYGRAGRQGAPGSAVSFVSLQDEVLAKKLPWWARPLAGLIGRQARPHAGGLALLLRLAQWQAQKRSARARRDLAERERQLAGQLSFSKK